LGMVNIPVVFSENIDNVDSYISSESNKNDETENVETWDAQSDGAQSENAQSENAESKYAKSENAESKTAESENAESKTAESENAESGYAGLYTNSGNMSESGYGVSADNTGAVDNHLSGGTLGSADRLYKSYNAENNGSSQTKYSSL